MKGFKTVILGIAIAATGALSTPEMTAYIAEHLPYVSGGIGTVVVVLRAFTSSSIFNK